MRYYPISLDIKDKPCLVVGGGNVAERKVKGLLKADARVIVVSPAITEGLEKLKKNNKIKHIARVFKKDDIKGKTLVICASDSKTVNEAASKEAVKKRIPFNVVDSPEKCAFIVPSVIERGPLTIAISTSGKSPALAKRLRLLLEKKIGKEYEILAEILGAIRETLLKKGAENVKNKRVFNILANSRMPEWIKTGSIDRVEKLLKKLLGPGFTLRAIGMRKLKTTKG